MYVQRILWRRILWVGSVVSGLAVWASHLGWGQFGMVWQERSGWARQVLDGWVFGEFACSHALDSVAEVAGQVEGGFLVRLVARIYA